MEGDNMTNEQTVQLVALARQYPVHFLATINGQSPVIRSMWLARCEDDGTIWYASARNSKKVTEIRQNPQVGIAMYAPDKDIRVQGKAEIIDDPETKNALWQPSWITYFASNSDPEYLLIKVTPASLQVR